LQRKGIDGVFEQYVARRRSTDFRLGKRLGAIISSLWKRPPWMREAHYEQAPDRLEVRELKAGGEILVTQCAA